MGGRGGSSGISAGGGSLEQKSEKWYLSLTDKEQAAVVAYTGYNYTNDPNRKEMTDTLDNALSKFKTDKELVTYRGVSGEEFSDTLFSGETKTTFKSTSTDASRAEAFAKSQGGYIIEYHIKKGNHGAFLDGGVPMSVEKEFLINRNQKMKIVSSKGKKMIVEIG
jgi:hypothetical protein